MSSPACNKQDRTDTDTNTDTDTDRVIDRGYKAMAMSSVHIIVTAITPANKASFAS